MKAHLVKGPWICSQYSDMVMRYVYRFSEYGLDSSSHGRVTDVWLEKSGAGDKRNSTYLKRADNVRKYLIGIKTIDELNEFANRED